MAWREINLDYDPDNDPLEGKDWVIALMQNTPDNSGRKAHSGNTDPGIRRGISLDTGERDSMVGKRD